MIKTKIWSLILFMSLLCISTAWASSSNTSTSLYDLNKKKKTSVINHFDQVRNNVYDKYDKLWKPVVETVVYKSLVCLWAITNPFSIAVLDTAKDTLKKSILEEYISLDGKVKRYELWMISDYTWIQSDIIAFSGKYIPQINQFQTNQLLAISWLIQSVRDYTNQNTQLINTISNNITKIENINNWYETIVNKINILQNWSFSWQSDFIKNLNNSKNISVNILISNLQTQQDNILKRYKKLTGLDFIITDYKQNLLNIFSQDTDNYINSMFSWYYDYTKFAQLKTDLIVIKKDFYSWTNLICSNIISKYNTATDRNLLNIQSRIDILTSWLNASVSSISSGWLSDTFKQKALQSIKTFYSKRLNSDLQLFKTFTYQKIDLLFNNLLNIPVVPVNNSITWQVPSSITLKIPQWFSFTKPFNINDKSDSIKTLQQLLTNIWLYSWSINWIYDSITKNAVYLFQLRNWLLIWYENKPATRWWMWPATRNSLNKLITNNY
jgi:hypothetical protein